MSVDSSLACFMIFITCVISDFVAFPYLVVRYLAAYMKSGLTVWARTLTLDARLLKSDCKS